MNNIIPQNKFKNFHDLANSSLLYIDDDIIIDDLSPYELVKFFGRLLDFDAGRTDDWITLGDGVLKVISYKKFHEAKLYTVNFRNYLYRQEHNFFKSKKDPSELFKWQKYIINQTEYLTKKYVPYYQLSLGGDRKIHYHSYNELKQQFNEHIIPFLKEAFADKRKKYNIRKGLVLLEEFLNESKNSKKKLKKYQEIKNDIINDLFKQHKEENLSRSLRRTRQNIKHYLNCFDADHLITLTFRGVITDREYVKECLKKFISYIRKGFLWKGRVDGRIEKKFIKLNFDYLAVLEKHKSGGYHIHMGVHGKQNIDYLRFAWYKAIGNFSDDLKCDINGQINIQYIKAKNPSNMVANYLTKYVTKDFENLDKNNRYKRRFWRSKNANKGFNEPEINYHYVKEINENLDDNCNYYLVKNYLKNALKIIYNNYKFSDYKKFHLKEFIVEKTFNNCIDKIHKNKKTAIMKINYDNIYKYCENSFPDEFDVVYITLLKHGRFNDP